MQKWKEVIKEVPITDNNDTHMTIVGSIAEKEKAYEIYNFEELQSFKSRIKVLISKDSIWIFKVLLKKADLFVGHDSMVGHLSSFNNIQCLTISLGTVRYIETNPYGEGNYNIIPKTKCFPCFPSSECDNFKCHLDIPTKIVASSITCLIEDGFISEENY